jgi:hypothetical protein
VITIPTADLTGILGDTIPFAFPDDDFPDLHCVRLEWDGTRLHALTTDRYRIGISTWLPGEAAEGKEVQDDLFTDWGSGDDPWWVTIALPDAVELVKVFKLPPKEAVGTAVTVDYDPGYNRVTVKRARDTGHSAITVVAESSGSTFPDVRRFLANADRVKSLRTVSYSAKFMADFGKVRQTGPMQLSFTGTLTHISIGERFVGAIMPVGRSIED